MKKFWLAAALAAGLTSAVHAGMPLQLGIAGDYAQIFAQEREITGLKLNLPYAVNDYASGIDLGIVGNVGEFTGLRLNAFNYTGIRCSGVELGLVNIDEGEFTGFQFGAINRVEDMHGFQLGLINVAHRLHGIQLGLLNVVTGGRAHSAILFVNWNF